MFGKDGVLISPDASDALYNKPVEATPADPMENSKPSGEDPPAAEEQKPPSPAESQQCPPSAGNGLNTDPQLFTSSEENTSPSKDTNAGESSEVAKERLEKLVADAIQGANLPPGTSINVTISVNTPEPPMSGVALAGNPLNKDETYQDEYIETGPVEAEPVEAEVYSQDLKERNDILASVSVEPTSPLASGYSVASPVSPADKLLEGLEYVKSEDNVDKHTYLSVSPPRASPLPAPPSTLPRQIYPALAAPTPVLSIVPPSPPTVNTNMSQPSVVPVSPTVETESEEQPSIDDLMAGLMSGEEPTLNPEEDSDNEEQAL
eukprot:gene13558-15602_t